MCFEIAYNLRSWSLRFRPRGRELWESTWSQTQERAFFEFLFPFPLRPQREPDHEFHWEHFLDPSELCLSTASTQIPHITMLFFSA
jgi:hypothetical protein